MAWNVQGRHVRQCTLAGTSATGGVWASDHYAVVAEVEL
jgi:hypothetical protein